MLKNGVGSTAIYIENTPPRKSQDPCIFINTRSKRAGQNAQAQRAQSRPYHTRHGVKRLSEEAVPHFLQPKRPADDETGSVLIYTSRAHRYNLNSFESTRI